MIRSIFYWVTTLISIVFTVAVASAAPGGGQGKPGGGGGEVPTCAPDALFPALMYPVDSASGDGRYHLMIASSDGCVVQTIGPSIQLGGFRLKYDEITKSGYYAWAENVYPGLPPGAIKRQHFSVTDGELTPTSFDILYEGVGYLTGFDLQGDVLTLVDDVGEETLLVIDISACEGGLPCVNTDGVAVYKPNLNCLSDAAIAGCFRPQPDLTLASSGDTIYFAVHGNDFSGLRVYGIARVSRGTDGWAPQTPELFLRDDNYREVGAGGLSLSADNRYLLIGYLAGFQNGGLRDDRKIILDTAAIGENCPCEAAGFVQNFSAWTATWTVNDTVYVLGTAGKGRKLTFPIEELDPVTGVRTPLGISLTDHPQLDSSL
jgi:hypothetical protein